MRNILTGFPEEKLTPAQEGSATAEELILHNMREAYYYCRGCYQGRRLDEGEVLSAAYEALTKAAKNFRAGETRFMAYAKAYLRGALSEAVRNLNVVKKNVPLEALPDSEGQEDDHKDVDAPCLKPVIRAHSMPCEQPDFDKIFWQEDWAEITPLLRTVLTDRERMVLELHYRGALSLEAVAELCGFTRSYWQNQKQTALKKIRHHLMEKQRFFNRT